MGIIQSPSVQPGQVGTLGAFKFMVTTDNLATITAAGYLNNIDLAVYPILASDNIVILYSYNLQTNSGTFGIFQPSISNGVITLVEWINPGDVLLPVVANHIAMFNGTSGQIYDGSATAIHGGSIQAGLATGTAGTFISYAASNAKGSLILAAVANTGNTNTTISNVAMGQASVISIPDPANALGRFLIGATATPFVSGNIPAASGTGGLMVDSGKSAAAIPTFTSPTIANHIAVFTNTSGNLGEDAAPAINGGNIQAGLSGTAGTLSSFPATAANGSLILAAINNSGGFNTTISNSNIGQSTVYSLPDPGAATANILVNAGSQVGNLKLNGAFVSQAYCQTILAASLATAGKVNVWVAPSVTAQIAILDIKVFKSTGLSGGGGDRLLSLTDGTLVFNNTGITAALLGTPVFTQWGGTGNPVTSATEVNVSTAGANVYLQYISGATDYTTGSVIVAVTYAQVTA